MSLATFFNFPSLSLLQPPAETRTGNIFLFNEIVWSIVRLSWTFLRAAHVRETKSNQSSRLCVWNHAYLLDYSAISEREPRELRARRAAASLVSSVQKGPPPTERCEPNQLLPHNADSDAGRDASVDSSSSSSDLAAKGGWVYVFSLRIAHVRVNKREWQSKDECERDREREL